ncbi:hypothetical protein [Nocardiopsis trehalosi]|uniref:hypothetical protein n=1 Tax=Nocardiopsis trehalosi TaxID=109329 RepID=UPI000830F779|nr:hypothetical protein [Nocardiopsis trehalosi]
MPVLAGATTTPGAGAGSFTHALQGAPTAAAPSDTSPLLWAAMVGGAVLALAAVLVAVSGAGQRAIQASAPEEGHCPRCAAGRHTMYLTGGLFAVAALAVRACGQRAASAVPVP